ncbi:MAG: hypothetical protein A2Z04_04775 [Chloroflexi bacterium RBG_16_57_9]|nr:MAG: hypothetical protein A2Z04_04775 [Chloroflexi bacterium RBG_16_57_9]
MSNFKPELLDNGSVPNAESGERQDPPVVGKTLARKQRPALKLFTEGWTFTVTSRFLPALFFVLVEFSKIQELVRYIRRGESGGDSLNQVVFYAAIGYRLAMLMFFALVIVLFVVRLKPVRKAEGIMPTVMAIVGAFMMTLVALLPQAPTSLLQTISGTLLLLLGSAISVAALSVLGRSFSLTPEARRLVTAGPYAIVRHPVYLGEALASAGMVVQSYSLFALGVCLAFVWVQIQRMKYEETVLGQVFPEYEAYKLKTARLFPKVY